jgi:phosphohistidine phosphatase SixA
MKRGHFLIVLFLILGCSRPTPPTTFILLRHAEKASDGTEDPDLKAEGAERAQRLAELLKYTQVDGIYTTNFKRTRQTVEPLADVKKLEVQPYEAFKADEIEKMLHKHGGGTIVICGHTNNIPWTANLLMGREEFEEL